MIQTGLDQLIARDFAPLRGKRIGVVCNQATVDARYDHILDLMLPHHRRGTFHIAGVFGPEHGLYGHTQDNMIEWEGLPDPRTGLRVHSLYGQHRKPTREMMDGIDLVVSDIPDIGSRYYTFVWTIAHVLEACVEFGIPMLHLDRPNPINGVSVEGPVLDMQFSSFVGLYPVPTRHGMTSGEILTWLQHEHLGGRGELEVFGCEGWDRTTYLDPRTTAWTMPSPNMPTIETATVYPGGCLLEATNLSEGRGTTRPFEIFGAPFLDGWALADSLNALRLPGVTFRPLPFEPTFNKHARTLCEGCFVHVTDRDVFEPVLTYVAIMQACISQTGVMDTAGLPRDSQFVAASAETSLPGFAWKLPPYEYVHDRRPIDILAGNDWLANAIADMTPIAAIRQRMADESSAFRAHTAQYLR
ncbi:MAG: DUF1343 domain-containing protein [Fimbriimonadaceae bacterium]|nr:DUF1343 domain-containing protein [Fimbriimonadaceae bacterium]